jgi:hypothetical protein
MLYKSLSPQGRASARTALMARAAEKSGGIDNLSPDKFASEVKRLGAQVGIFFEGQDLQRIKGLTRVLDLTKRAGEAAAHPTTGAQLAWPVGAAVLTDVLGGAGAATVSAAAIGGVARLLESAPVRNILLKIPRTQKGSKEEAALVKRLLSLEQLQSDNVRRTVTEGSEALAQE